MEYRLTHSAENPLYVVFPPAITTFAFETAEKICCLVERLSGIRPVRTTSPSVPEGSAAITVADPRFPETSDALASLNYGECLTHFPAENLLCISTHTEDTLPAAYGLLERNLSRGEGCVVCAGGIAGRKISLPGYLKYIKPIAAGTQVACRESHDSCSQVVVTDVGREDFDAYVRELSASGFADLYRFEAAGNIFHRLEKEGCSAYLYHTSFNRTARILAEPAENAPLERRESFIPSVCRPLMTVIGARWSDTATYLNKDAGSGNMVYIFRLEDGSFIAVDGGMELGDYAEKMLALMEEQSPAGQKPRVRCWFISHTHIDHSGAFLKIAAKYPDRVTVDEVACNFPSIRDAEIFREAWNTRRIKEAVYGLSGTKYTKLHTGQSLSIGGAEVTVLWTQDDLVRQYLSLGNATLNTASVCLKLEIGGSSILLPADCDETANGIMLSMWGDFLKSDILQVCHHGGWGGTTEFYAAVDPALAIFSTSDELLPMYLQIKYNHDLVYGMNVREVHNNADRCRVFSLPYTPPAEKILPPDPAGDILYTKAKQLEALAQIDILRGGSKA